MTPLLGTLAAAMLAGLIGSVVDAKFRHPAREFSVSEIEPAPRLIVIRIAATFVFSAWVALVAFLLSIVLAKANVWQSEPLTLGSLSLVVTAGVIYLAAAALVKCPKCGRPLLFQWVTQPKFAEPYRGLDGWASIIVRVVLRKPFRCMYCGQRYAS